MKKLFIVSCGLLASQLILAQGYVSDRVYMGASYAHEVFYSLSNDSVGSSLVKNWDLAFSVYGGTSDEFLSILANHMNGVNVYLNNTPASQTHFDTFDSTGYQSWQKLYNSDTSWWYGAFNREPYAHPNYSWATYTTNGTMNGRYIYLIELTATGQPAQYKKLWIKKKSSISGSVSLEFTYANLDGSDMQTVSLTDVQNTYPGKRYMFYSLRNHQALDREPARDAWDITFTRYLAYLTTGGTPTYYPVTGVLSNQGVKVARVAGVLPADAQEGMAPYESRMNTIGHDWKAFNNSTFQWVIADTLSYFVKDVNGAIWHLYFTDFGGQSNGMSAFEKKLISAASLENPDATHSLPVYPNPAESLTFLVTDLSESSVGNLEVIDFQGRVVRSSTQFLPAGFAATPLNVEALPGGLYILRLRTSDGTLNARLVVNR